MSVSQIAPDPDILRLLDEGYELEIVSSHLVVHAIPYVNAERKVCRGALVAPYTGIGKPGVSAVPKDHTMRFQGEKPHHTNSLMPMNIVINREQRHEPFRGFLTHYYLSNKPNGVAPRNYYDLVTHYHSLFRAEAQLVEANADGRTGVIRPDRNTDSPFSYPDTASSRVGITAISQRFEGMKIAIIGLGGTGSYILDLVCKSPVMEIHLFDGDFFDSHNAYRSPGAATIEEVNSKYNKTDFFQNKYSCFHKGIVSNPVRIDESNLDIIEKFDFVFVSVDSGSSRGLISNHLTNKGVPFIDVGLGMSLTGTNESDQSLTGICRATLITPEKSDHLSRCLDTSNDHDDLYQSNIQVAELNSINASLAVLKWKQYVGALDDQSSSHNLRLSFSLMSLIRSECLEGE